MSLPFQYQLLAINVFVNNNDKNNNIKELKQMFENNQKRKYNLNAKAYSKRNNNKNNNNSNYIRGVNPNMNATGSRSFNGCSNRSYKQ